MEQIRQAVGRKVRLGVTGLEQVLMTVKFLSHGRANFRALRIGVNYHALASPSDMSFPWKSLWKVKILPGVAFSCWTTALGKLLTIDNLHKRGIGVLGWCYMCKGKTETLRHCRIASELWSMVFGLFWGCIGSCPNPLLICLLLGIGALKSIEMVLFGKLLCIGLCGVFGERGMLKVLKISKETGF